MITSSDFESGLGRRAVRRDGRQLDAAGHVFALNAHVRLRRRGRAGADLLGVDDGEDVFGFLQIDSPGRCGRVLQFGRPLVSLFHVLPPSVVL